MTLVTLVVPKNVKSIVELVHHYTAELVMSCQGADEAPGGAGARREERLEMPGKSKNSGVFQVVFQISYGMIEISHGILRWFRESTKNGSRSHDLNGE